MYCRSTRDTRVALADTLDLSSPSISVASIRDRIYELSQRSFLAVRQEQHMATIITQETAQTRLADYFVQLACDRSDEGGKMWLLDQLEILAHSPVRWETVCRGFKRVYAATAFERSLVLKLVFIHLKPTESPLLASQAIEYAHMEYVHVTVVLGPDALALAPQDVVHEILGISNV